VTYGVNQPIIYPGAEGGTIYLGANSFGDTTQSIGVFGQSSPGVITVTQSTTPSGQQYILKDRLWYRSLRTSGAQVKLYRIELCGDTDTATCAAQFTGTSKMVLTFKGTDTIPGNPDEVVTRIGVRLT